MHVCMHAYTVYASMHVCKHFQYVIVCVFLVVLGTSIQVPSCANFRLSANGLKARKFSEFATTASVGDISPM